jgi:glucose/arabinose dehydrogenase
MRLTLCLSALLVVPLLHAAAPNGQELYQANCSMCHGVEGLGMTTVFPPLAKSDFLVKNREKALRGPMEGLSGPITVNGNHYEGGMPPAFLDDEQLTAVFNHVFTSWGNDVKPVTVEEITRIRATTKYPTLAALTASMVGDKLPTPPAGWELKIGAELSFGPTRLAMHPDGEHVLALSMKADVWMWKPGSSETTLLFKSEDILDKELGDPLVMGMTVDSKGRLYITSNQCNKKTSPVSNEMIIFRTEPWQKGQPWAAPKTWYHTQNPFGIGPYNHGLSHIAQGPDGLLYVNSGARTDSGEAGKQPNYATTGEEPNTSAMWQMDPEAAKPTVTIFAKGLRNNYGFCWDDEKRMIATENGPDAHAPEELNVVEKDHHYGFPFQYSDWTNKPYPHTPDIPAGLKITLPFRNLGPDGGGSEKGISTFDPHSCPTGIVWLDEKWPAPLGGTFITTRFGNMLKLEGGDTGFDVLQLKLNFADKTLHTTKLLAPLGRPIDVLKLPIGHRLIIAEHSRATTMEGGTGTPGRLLILQPK